jgi:hypothetical protein
MRGFERIACHHRLPFPSVPMFLYAQAWAAVVAWRFRGLSARLHSPWGQEECSTCMIAICVAKKELCKQDTFMKVGQSMIAVLNAIERPGSTCWQR